MSDIFRTRSDIFQNTRHIFQNTCLVFFLYSKDVESRRPETAANYYLCTIT